MKSIGVEVGRKSDHAQSGHCGSHRRQSQRHHVKGSTSQKKIPGCNNSFSAFEECEVETQGQVGQKKYTEDNNVDVKHHIYRLYEGTAPDTPNTALLRLLKLYKMKNIIFSSFFVWLRFARYSWRADVYAL